MRLKDIDIALIKCFLFSKDLNNRKIVLEPRVMLTWCKTLHGKIDTKDYNQTTYNSLKKLNSLGVLKFSFSKKTYLSGKKYKKYNNSDKYEVDMKALLKFWKSTDEYEISKGLLIFDGDIPSEIRDKIIVEYSKGKIVLDTERWW